MIGLPAWALTWVEQASEIQSDRDIFLFSQDLSMDCVRLSSIVMEYRTI